MGRKGVESFKLTDKAKPIFDQYRQRHVHACMLRKQVLDGIDGLADMADTTKSDVLDSFADYCLKNEEIIDELFPILDEEAEEED